MKQMLFKLIATSALVCTAAYAAQAHNQVKADQGYSSAGMQLAQGAGGGGGAGDGAGAGGGSSSSGSGSSGPSTPQGPASLPLGGTTDADPQNDKAGAVERPVRPGETPTNNPTSR